MQQRMAVKGISQLNDQINIGVKTLLESADILTTEAEIEQWMTASAEDALKQQRPLPDTALKVVATDERKDEAG
jgi:hypothetical protein